MTNVWSNVGFNPIHDIVSKRDFDKLDADDLNEMARLCALWAVSQAPPTSALAKRDCEILDREIDRRRDRKLSETMSNPKGPDVPAQAIDPRKVFVIHGRDTRLRNSMFTFLRSIGLHPLEWSEATAATGHGTPYTGDILEKAFSEVQAFVVLFTPDDEAQLKEEFRTSHDPEYESALTGQARANVLFEAGMAMGMQPKRTVLVEAGKLRPFSDTYGRHTVRLRDNSIAQRQELATRLKTAGCAVNTTGTDWHTEGDFEVKDSPRPKPASKAEPAPVLDDDMKKFLVRLFHEAGGVTMDALCHHLGVVKSAGMHYEDELRGLGYVTRNEDKLLTLTALGRKYVMTKM